MKNAKQLVKEIIELQKNYAKTERAMTTRERYENVYKTGLLSELDFEHKSLREPLIEHVGHLPIIATYLHPHIENRDKVNLGKSLIILAVHDIGETVMGDILTYDKTDADEEKETNVAKNLLDESLIEYYDAYGKLNSFEAKFAKSVDSLAPMLHELDMPEVTLKRFKHFGFNEEKINNKKRKYFKWDSVLLEIFDYGIEEFKRMREG